MSIEQAEQLKRELTDKWVVVANGVPELRRFSELTGKVKTVNMNCRALVEFDGPEDIGWYDIDPQFLTVVDAPRPKKKVEEKAKPAAEKKATSAKAAGGVNPLDAIRAGGAAKSAGGGSPLDAIRAQGGAKKDADKPAAGGSPLDQIRAQAGNPAPTAGANPLDQIRAQAAGGAAAAKEPTEKPEPEAKEEPAAKAPAAPAPTGNPLDVIRAQGGFKG